MAGEFAGVPVGREHGTPAGLVDDVSTGVPSHREAGRGRLRGA
ncbi:hypothetical protein ACF1B0_34490 [Streptomyces anandii]